MMCLNGWRRAPGRSNGIPAPGAKLRGEAPGRRAPRAISPPLACTPAVVQCIDQDFAVARERD